MSLLILVSMSFVSAADNVNDTATLTVSDDTMKISNNNEEILSGGDEGNFSSLASEISSTSEGDTLNLTQDYTYDSSTDSDYTSGIAISKAITIDGKGHTISGNNSARIFYITASNVVLKNIIFTNGYLNETDSYGGAIYWSGDNGNVKNCTFSNGYVNGNNSYGGAIYWSGDYGNVENSTFSSNNVVNTMAGAICWLGNYGVVNNSKFTGNKGKTSGAIYWNGTSGNLTNCIFTSNTATVSDGGAVGWYGKSGYIYNCNFTSNTAFLMSGALNSLNTNLNISNCNFNTNTAGMIGGGAIRFVNTSADIYNCNFNSNAATLYSFYFYNGGAICWLSDGNYSGKGNVVNCTFTGNKGANGTSIYMTSALSIYNSTFTDASNAKTIYNNGELYLENNTVNNDNTIVSAGTITSQTNVTISAPTTSELGDAITITGNIYDDNNNTIILSSLDVLVGDDNVSATFASNGTFTATYKSKTNGTLTVSVDTTNIPSASVETATVTVVQKDPTFTTLANYVNATEEGETLELTQNYTYNSETDSNYTSGIVIDKNITIDGKGFTINGNDVARIFYVNGSTVTFKNITFINGYATDGGAIYSNSETTITDCTFESNAATSKGGAVYAAGGNIYTSTFVNNAANKGGAVYFADNRANITDSVFRLNTATTNGGAAYFEKKAYISNSNFTSNEATTNNGGALYFEKTAEVTNCKLINNSAPEGNGGGLFLKDEDKSVDIINSTFNSNTADKGGAAYIKGEGTISGSSFTNNSVTKHAGAVYINRTASISNSNFTNNSAVKKGGAIFLEQDADIVNCIFTGNNATTGTSVYSNNTSISDSTFADAESSCAVYNIGNLSSTNNEFKNNNYIESSSITSAISIVLYDVTCYIYHEVNITGAIFDSNNNLIKFSDIVLTLNGTNLTTNFNDDGTFYSTFAGNLSNIGSYVISATGYSDKLSNVTLTEATLNVIKLSPNINIIVSSTTYPNNVVITVTADVDGSYSYSAASSKGNITISNGTSSITLSKLAIGNYAVTVAYGGSENYSSQSVSKSFKIIAPIQSNKNVNMFYLDGSTYKVRVYGADGNVAKGVKVTFTINKVTYTRTTDSNGWATLSLNIKKLVPKSYTVTAKYNGYTVKNTVKVKQIIKAKKTTGVKKTAKQLKIKITLKGKTVLKKKTLKVKFKGKTYKVKTNKKGVAVFKLTKKVISKLKAGKKYAYAITYQNDVVKRYIKVKK